MKKELFVLQAKKDVNFEIKLTKDRMYKVFKVKDLRGGEVPHFLIYDDTNHFVYAHHAYFKPVD